MCECFKRGFCLYAKEHVSRIEENTYAIKHSAYWLVVGRSKSVFQDRLFRH